MKTKMIIFPIFGLILGSILLVNAVSSMQETDKKAAQLLEEQEQIEMKILGRTLSPEERKQITDNHMTDEEAFQAFASDWQKQQRADEIETNQLQSLIDADTLPAKQP